MRIEESLEELALQSSLILVCVRDDAAVDAVLFGDDGLYNYAKPGTLIADMSTVSPSASKLRAAQLKERRIEFVDSPIVGGTSATENANSILLVGGTETNCRRLTRSLRDMFKSIYHMGPLGMGNNGKLAFNLLVAFTITSFSEFLAFASKVNIELGILRKVLSDSSLQSSFYLDKFEKVSKREFNAGFTLELLSKDLDLVCKIVSDRKSYQPLAKKVARIIKESSKQGKHLDYSALISEYEERNNRPLIFRASLRPDSKPGNG